MGAQVIFKSAGDQEFHSAKCGGAL